MDQLERRPWDPGLAMEVAWAEQTPKDTRLWTA